MIMTVLAASCIKLFISIMIVSGHSDIMIVPFFAGTLDLICMIYPTELNIIADYPALFTFRHI